MANKFIKVVLNKQPRTDFELSDAAYAEYKAAGGKAPRAKVGDNRIDPLLVAAVEKLGSSKASGKAGSRRKCWLVVARVRNVHFEISTGTHGECCALEEEFENDTVSKIGMPVLPPAAAATALVPAVPATTETPLVNVPVPKATTAL